MSSPVLNTMFGFDIPASGTVQPEGIRACPPLLWSDSRFGKEQIRSLVQQVFFPGGSKVSHQVVFSAVDQDAQVGEICRQVGSALCAQDSGSVCVVEVKSGETRPSQFISPAKSGCLRDSAVRLSNKLWLLPAESFSGKETSLSSSWVRTRMDELRLDFDYTIFHAPSAGRSGDAALLGHLCDGVVLILNANLTRRVAAKRVKEQMLSASACLLGTVLSDRKFPIPQGIYRRL